MPLLTPPSDAELDRYLSGHASADEARRVEAWLASSAPVIEPNRTDARWVRLRDRVGHIENKGPAHGTRVRITWRLRPTTRVFNQTLVVAGASIALVAMIAFGRSTTTSIVPSSAQTYTTAAGEQQRITLGDGSMVRLAPSSTLRVPADFGHEIRRVQLDGQAQFIVRQTAGLSFVVQTGRVTTRVLGTTFDVRRYSGDPHVRVAVTQGKVAVGSSDRRVTLTAGLVAYATDSSAVLATMERAGEVSAWTNGHLAFQEASIGTVLAQLERWYGYRFTLTDTAMASRPVTVTFDANDRQGTLVLLRHVLGVTMQFDSNTVTLRPRRPAARDIVPRSIGRPKWSTSTQVGR
jgi:ferric-dicitrate binding protein FerR (iron transport regulator)